MIRILFQGDSITDGGRNKDEEKRWMLDHQVGHSYVYAIATHLLRNYPGKYEIINRGVAGDCIDKIAARWETDTLALKPDVLSILLGINGNGAGDGTHPEGVEEHLARFDALYRSLLEAARAENPNLKLIIMEPFLLPVGRHKETYGGYMSLLSRKQKLIRQIAEDYGAVFLPLQKPFEELVSESAPVLLENGSPVEPNAYWLWDGVHPAEAGHGFLAERWLAAAEELLASL